MDCIFNAAEPRERNKNVVAQGEQGEKGVSVQS